MQQIAYELNGALYLNLTNACPNRCVFCVRDRAPGVGGYDLRLEREPDASAVLAAVGNPDGYTEIVFCGYGEPTCRLATLLTTARALHGKGVPIRLNTNGLGNLINNRDIVPELSECIDIVSISLNAPDADTYERICRPAFGRRSFSALLDFIRQSKTKIPRVIVSVVPCPGIDVPACRRLAGELGVEFRLRQIIATEE